MIRWQATENLQRTGAGRKVSLVSKFQGFKVSEVSQVSKVPSFEFQVSATWHQDVEMVVPRTPADY
jgi:hypothetical protein